jgi:hypothetical protein
VVLVCAGAVTAALLLSSSTRPNAAITVPTTTATATSPSQPPVTPNATELAAYKGTGPLVITPMSVPRGVRVVTIRFTCVGAGNTAVRGVDPKTMIFRTNGCLRGEWFAASFTINKAHDPHQLTVTVGKGVSWQLEVWSGRYVVQPAPPATV